MESLSPEVKKPQKHKLEERSEDGPVEKTGFLKKKVAMLVCYCGKDYYGMQRNPGFKTIESELLEAFSKGGVVRPDHTEDPSTKMSFQRAARTDKGVSAAGQVISFKMFINCADAISLINSHLPPQIRVFGFKKTTKSFDSKNYCNSRTYSYLMPSYALAHLLPLSSWEELQKFRLDEEKKRKLNDLLKMFVGTHNFHNYTSGKTFSDPSSNRYITKFNVEKVYVKNDLEYVLMKVKGQSFMLHQIRKMIGTAIVILRELVAKEYIDESWKKQKLDIPKAPGLGLVLEQVHYDNYNKKYGGDGIHESILWQEFQNEIDQFKEDHIFDHIYNTESTERTMLKWIESLSRHNFTFKEEVRERN